MEEFSDGRKVRETAERLGVTLSVHGPYYINLNAAEAEKVGASRQRILKAAQVGWLCGARNHQKSEDY
ncbi:MAG: hypothetical protein U9R11_02635 [Chloroflexota bacterium]|nr:hypothetical protein [Chloroflexota bacterium]